MIYDLPRIPTKLTFQINENEKSNNFPKCPGFN